MLARAIILLILASACVSAGVGIAIMVAGVLEQQASLFFFGLLLASIGYMTIDMMDGIDRWMRS